MTQPLTSVMTILRVRHLHMVMPLLLALIMVSGAASDTIASIDADPGSSHKLTAQDLPARHEDPLLRTYASTELLSEGRQTQLNADLNRLRIKGVEPVIFMRYTDDDVTSSRTLAEELRLGWPVETARGADDGLVVVVSVDRTNPEGSTVNLSFGGNVPARLGWSPEELASWGQQQLLSGIQSGDYLSTLSYGVRLLNGTIFDQVGLLTERQRNVLNGDVNRLQRLGVPNVVYIETVDASPLAPQDRADELRRSLGVDSRPDADESLLFLLSVDLNDSENSTFVVSRGSNALPIRQLDAETLDRIIADHVVPNVQQGNEYQGIAHAVRRTINYAEYSAPIPPPLSSAQQSARLPLNIVAAVLVQLAIIGYLLAPALIDKRMSIRPSRRSLLIYGLLLGPLAVAVGAAGILGRNPAAALVGLGVFIWAAIAVPLIARPSSSAPIAAPPSPSGIEDHSGAHDASPAN